MKITRAQLKKIIKEELSLLNENYNMNEEGDDVPEMKEYSDGSKEWRLNGILHRTDGPAVERSDGSKEWWLNGERHRTDGPAVEYSNGRKEWWLNNKKVTWRKVYDSKKGKL